MVDGNRCPDVHNCIAIVKGDVSEQVISAASIVAKVTRDRIMKQYDMIFPGYGLSRNMGYGTKKHMEAIQNNGITTFHRKSFTINWITIISHVRIFFCTSA